MLFPVPSRWIANGNAISSLPPLRWDKKPMQSQENAWCNMGFRVRARVIGNTYSYSLGVVLEKALVVQVSTKVFTQQNKSKYQ